MGARNEKPRPATWLASENIDFRDGRVNPRWAERHAVDVVEGGDAGEHQNSLQPRLETGQYIGAQVIADDHRLLGVSLHFIQR